MVDTSNYSLEKLIIHKVGNKNNNDGIQFSEQAINLEDKITEELLIKYFLGPFKEEKYFSFTHESSLNLNEIYHYCDTIFNNSDLFLEQSIHIAKHLYEASLHPMIKAGELYICHFRDLIIDEEVVDAIGLFKSENKDPYLKVYLHNKNFEVNHENGININKLDKGCLILNTEKDLGYKVMMVDNTNKLDNAHFWKDQFLGIKARKDNFYYTKNELEVVAGFVEEVYNTQNAIEKTDQIDLLKKSVSFFNEQKDFTPKVFEEAIFEKENEKQAFAEYRKQFSEENPAILKDEFSIAPKAISQIKKYIKGKSVLKLDKNFHIYVHGNREFLEKGWDDQKRMHFYKLFFQDEY
jgi:hypothetical protein